MCAKSIDFGEWWPAVVQVRKDESLSETIRNRNEKKNVTNWKCRA